MTILVAQRNRSVKEKESQVCMCPSAGSQIHQLTLTFVWVSAKLGKEGCLSQWNLIKFIFDKLWLTSVTYRLQIINSPLKYNSTILQGCSLKTENSLSIFKGAVSTDLASTKTRVKIFLEQCFHSSRSLRVKR